MLLQKSAGTLDTLHRLKALGLNIVLDDFGTGYSSLSYLRMFPFDKIKIDKSFVQEMPNRADCAAIVCAVTSLGRSLQIDTTAEGVETPEQFTLLQAAGCTQAQGYPVQPAAAGGRTRFRSARAGPPQGRSGLNRAFFACRREALFSTEPISFPAGDRRAF